MQTLNSTLQRGGRGGAVARGTSRGRGRGHNWARGIATDSSRGRGRGGRGQSQARPRLTHCKSSTRRSSFILLTNSRSPCDTTRMQTTQCYITLHLRPKHSRATSLTSAPASPRSRPPSSPATRLSQGSMNPSSYLLDGCTLPLVSCP